MTVNIDLTGVVLDTERLILRTWREDDLNDFYETLANSGRQNSELYENIKGHERTLHSVEDTYFRGNDEQYTTDLGSLAKKVISSLYSADPSQSRIPHVFIVQPIPRIETILKI